MGEILFTTADVAKMLYVDKSTVKRWTAEGKLKCFRTPGGHRKFRADDLYQFMAEFNYGISPINLFPQLASDEAVMRRMIQKKEFNSLASVCFSAAIKGKKDDLVKLFTEVHKNGLMLPILFDEILRPSLKRIHDLQKSGKLSAAEFHLAQNALSNAIILLSDIIIKPSQTGKKVLCASFENSFSDLMLKALGILLESEGFEVLNLGTYATQDSVTQLIRSQKPNFLFIFSAAAENEIEFIERHRAIKSEMEAIGGTLVVSGQAYAAAAVQPHLETITHLYCATFNELSIVQHERHMLRDTIQVTNTNIENKN
jgi:MerR family transcriptional regulator, light-induced transcriptional regulator